MDPVPVTSATNLMVTERVRMTPTVGILARPCCAVQGHTPFWAVATESKAISTKLVMSMKKW